MTVARNVRADADGGWKDIIEEFTEEFFEFYFPTVHREVDFSGEITFLERVVRLCRFMGFLMRLPDDLAVKYRKELESIEGELNMPYITDTERLAENEGLRRGRNEGLRKGRQEGRKEGELQGLREAVTDALEVRFGEVPYTVREAVHQVDSETRLRELHRLAITTSSLDDFRV